MTYAELEDRLARGAASRPDVHALIVVGSRARPDRSADALSDLDLILFCADPAAYTDDLGWLAAQSEPRLSLLEHAHGPYPEWFVLLANGLQLDIMLAAVPVEAGAELPLSDILATFPYQNVLRRGMRILFTRAAPEQSEPYAPPDDGMAALPSADMFQELVSRALFEALRAAKLLARGDLWRAKQSCDCACKQHLLTMLEWHARALHGLHHDVWYDGRFLEQWADPDVIAALPETFGSYTLADVRRALLATLRLFGEVGRDTAAQLRYHYPATAEQQVLDDIDAMLGEL